MTFQKEKEIVEKKPIVTPTYIKKKKIDVLILFIVLFHLFSNFYIIENEIFPPVLFTSKHERKLW